MASLRIDEDAIICTSVPGHKLKIGVELSSAIRDELNASAIVIGLISTSAIQSGWVLFELGAAWGTGKTTIPILIPPVSVGDLPGPLVQSTSIFINSQHDLWQMIEEIGSQIGRTLRSKSKGSAAISELVDLAERSRAKEVEVARATLVKGETQLSNAEIELALGSELVEIPEFLCKDQVKEERSILQLFLLNYDLFADGVKRDFSVETKNGFLYAIAKKLLPFGIVECRSINGGEYYWDQELVLTPEGRGFYIFCKSTGVRS